MSSANAVASVPVTPINYPPYVEHDYDINYYLSIIESFLLILIAELGDKTFVMNIILQLRTNKVTVFWAASLAQVLMNIFAIFIGFTIDYCLYKNLIDYFGILFFVIYGLFLLGDSFGVESKSFEKELANIEEINKAKKEENPIVISHPQKENQLSSIFEVDPTEEESKVFDFSQGGGSSVDAKKYKEDAMKENIKEEENEDEDKDEDKDKNEENMDKNKDNFELKEENNNEPDEGLQEYQLMVDGIHHGEENNESTNIDKKIFWTIFRSMALAEFGDRTQISAMMMSSIFNLTGVLIGSCLALFLSCFLGVYRGQKMVKFLNEKVLCFALGFVFLFLGIQIYIGKRTTVITPVPV